MKIKNFLYMDNDNFQIPFFFKYIYFDFFKSLNLRTLFIYKDNKHITYNNETHRANTVKENKRIVLFMSFI